MLPTYPKVLRDWLHNLPKQDKLRETDIANRNLGRIHKHMKGKP